MKIYKTETTMVKPYRIQTNLWTDLDAAESFFAGVSKNIDCAELVLSEITHKEDSSIMDVVTELKHYDNTIILPEDINEKFSRMISAFQCDFSLAKQGKQSIFELNSKIKRREEKIMEDIELLEELEWNLRNGYMKIVRTEE